MGRDGRGLPIELPAEPLVESYGYHVPSAGGGLYVTHYTTGRHDFVLMVRSMN